MVSDRGTRWEGEDDEYGPPSELDLAWYIHNVVSLGYPKVRRDKPMNGQLRLDEEYLKFLSEAEDDHRDQSAWGPEGRP